MHRRLFAAVLRLMAGGLTGVSISSGRSAGEGLPPGCPGTRDIAGSSDWLPPCRPVTDTRICYHGHGPLSTHAPSPAQAASEVPPRCPQVQPGPSVCHLTTAILTGTWQPGGSQCGLGSMGLAAAGPPSSTECAPVLGCVTCCPLSSSWSSFFRLFLCPFYRVMLSLAWVGSGNGWKGRGWLTGPLKMHKMRTQPCACGPLSQSSRGATETSQPGWPEQQTFICDSSGGWEGQDQGAGIFGSS